MPINVMSPLVMKLPRCYGKEKEKRAKAKPVYSGMAQTREKEIKRRTVAKKGLLLKG